MANWREIYAVYIAASAIGVALYETGISTASWTNGFTCGTAIQAVALFVLATWRAA